ncbi:type II secretion system F family protein, partial [Patescibacteria group bacterium]|nr:type II secretion system F family protein [Patescibacteria group bacterium]
MAKFNYKAKEQSGRSINGVVEASTIEAAQKLLKEKDLIILSVKEKKELAFMDKITESFAHVSNRDIVFFSRELSVLVASTVPLVRALRIIVKQTSHKNFKKIISEIATDIEGGMKFSEALAHYPKVFDDFFVFMIKAGETTGRLDEVLNYLADQKEKDYILLSNVRNAMIYPAFIIFALIAVGIGALIFVVPQLTAILI